MNDPKVGTVHWISCRAKQGCPGKSVEYRQLFKLPNGGRSIRYKCLTCNGTFHITF